MGRRLGIDENTWPYPDFLNSTLKSAIFREKVAAPKLRKLLRTIFMTYVCDIGNGQRLLVENDGDDTQVALSSGDSGQQQNQSTGFNTGKWSKVLSGFSCLGHPRDQQESKA